MPSALPTFLRAVCSLYPFPMGHARLLKIIDRFPVPAEETLLYIRQIRASMYVHLRTYQGRQLFYFGTYDPMIGKAIKQYLRPGMTFYDIGANIGFYTLLAAKRLSDDGTVVSFEPQASPFRTLVKNVQLNSLRSVTPLHMALFRESGTAVLYQLSSMNDGEASLSSGNQQVFGSEQVNCSSLDSLVGDGRIPPPDVIKIDVEGAELQVLLGARTLLRDTPPRAIVFEGVDRHLRRFDDSLEDLLHFLGSSGFRTQFARRGRWRPFTTLAEHAQAGSPPNFLALPIGHGT